MDAKTVRALVDDLRAQLAKHPTVFETKDLAGKPVAARVLDAVEAKLGIELPPLLRDIHTTIGAPWGFYWSVREDAEALDAEESPAGQIEIIAASGLRWARGADRVLRFTNDGFGNGFALDYRGKGAPKLVWYDHDDPASLKPLREKTLAALFEGWAKQLFVCTESNGNDLDPVLALLRREKPKAKPAAPKPAAPKPAAPKPAALAPPAPPSAPAPPNPAKNAPAASSSDLARKVPKLRGLEDAIVALDVPRNATMLGVAFDGERALLAGTSGELFVIDLASGAQLSKQSPLGSVRDLLRLPDGRVVVAGTFGVMLRDVAAAISSEWFPDGASMLRLAPKDRVVLATDAGVRVVGLAGGKVQQKLAAKNVHAMTLLGDLLVTSHGADSVEIAGWDLATGARRWSTKEKALPAPAGIVADPAKKRVVTPLVGGGLVAWDASGKRIGDAPKPKASAHVSVAANATRVLGGNMGTFEILDRDGNLRVSLEIRAGTFIRPHAHPDGVRAIVVGDGVALSIDLPKLEALRGV